MSDYSPLALLHTQLALELKAVDGSGRLFQLPGENPDEMPRVLAARLVDGHYVAYPRNNLPEALIAELQVLTPERVYREHDRVRDLLGAVGSPWCGRTYVFSKTPEPDEYALAVHQDGKFVVDVDAVTAAEGWSSRSADFAAELAVETRPEFRRRGFSRQVCAAWAAHQLAAGRVAFYSHNLENIASAALARSLGVKHIFDLVNYE